MVTVSLCLIVRNEARFLEACLASCAGAHDEIVVVDTGSTDGTQDLARAHGAKLVEFAWCDDFAKARNAGVAAARGQWILQIDADERLAPGAVAAIRRFVAEGSADVGLFRIHDATSLEASPAAIVSGQCRQGERLLVPRLFRNADGFAYHGAIHEDVGEWIVRRSMSLAGVDADIVHFGRVPEIAAQRNKAARNQKLLAAWRDADKDDFAALGYLACELYESGDSAAARSAAEEGFARLAAGRAPAHRSALRLAVAKAILELEDGDGRAVLETLRLSRARDGEHPDYCFLEGRACEQLALTSRGRARQRWLARAEKNYEGALALSHVDYAQRFVPGSSGHAARVALAGVRIWQGAGERALSDVDQVLAEDGGHEQAQLCRAEALTDLGRAVEALPLLEPLLGATPDAWLLASIAAESLGALDDSLAMLEVAGQRARAGHLVARRRERHVDALTRRLAYLGRPEVTDSATGVLVALAAGLPFVTGTDTSRLQPNEESRVFVQNLARLGRHDAIERLFSARAEQAVPGVREQAVRALGELGVTVEDDGAPPVIVAAARRAEDLELLRAILAAHPAMEVTVLAPGSEVPEGQLARGRGRPVWISDRAFEQVAIWGEKLPHATFVLLGREDDDVEMGRGVARRVLAIQRNNLVSRPSETLAQLFAFVGEPTHDGPLASLNNQYGSLQEVSA